MQRVRDCLDKLFRRLRPTHSVRPVLARNGHKRKGCRCRFVWAKRTLRLRAPTSEIDPGCVKTCTSRECAELFSLFSSFDGDCQSGSFLIQRNRDKLSTRKPDVGVFTQSGSKAALTAPKTDFRYTPERWGNRPAQLVD